MIIWNIICTKHYSQKSNTIVNEQIKLMTISRDVTDIEPINKNHFEFLNKKHIDCEKKIVGLRYSLDRMRNFKSLTLCTVIVVSYLIIYFRFIFLNGISTLTIENLMYCISVINVLDTICSSIRGYVSNIFGYINSIIDYEIFDEKYVFIRKVLESKKELKEFRGDKIIIPKFDFNYNDEEEAFSIISNNELVFEKGKITLLDGKSGSGKSTLIKIISGNIGEIQEYKVKTMSYFEDKSNIGRDILVNEIALTLDEKDVDSKKLKEILKGVKLEDMFKSGRLKKENRESLSNGERQRVLLARALYNMEDSDLIVIDEPIGSLDKENAIEVIEFIKEYCNRDKKRAIILCSHQHEFIKEFIDKKYSITKKGNRSIIV